MASRSVSRGRCLPVSPLCAPWTQQSVSPCVASESGLPSGRRLAHKVPGPLESRRRSGKRRLTEAYAAPQTAAAWSWNMAPLDWKSLDWLPPRQTLRETDPCAPREDAPWNDAQSWHSHRDVSSASLPVQTTPTQHKDAETGTETDTDTSNTHNIFDWEEFAQTFASTHTTTPTHKHRRKPNMAKAKVSRATHSIDENSTLISKMNSTIYPSIDCTDPIHRTKHTHDYTHATPLASPNTQDPLLASNPHEPSQEDIFQQELDALAQWVGRQKQTSSSASGSPIAIPPASLSESLPGRLSAFSRALEHLLRLGQVSPDGVEQVVSRLIRPACSTSIDASLVLEAITAICRGIRSSHVLTPDDFHPLHVWDELLACAGHCYDTQSSTHSRPDSRPDSRSPIPSPPVSTPDSPLESPPSLPTIRLLLETIPSSAYQNVKPQSGIIRLLQSIVSLPAQTLASLLHAFPYEAHSRILVYVFQKHIRREPTQRSRRLHVLTTLAHMRPVRQQALFDAMHTFMGTTREPPQGPDWILTPLRNSEICRLLLHQWASRVEARLRTNLEPEEDTTVQTHDAERQKQLGNLARVERLAQEQIFRPLCTATPWLQTQVERSSLGILAHILAHHWNPQDRVPAFLGLCAALRSQQRLSALYDSLADRARLQAYHDKHQVSDTALPLYYLSLRAFALAALACRDAALAIRLYRLARGNVHLFAGGRVTLSMAVDWPPSYWVPYLDGLLGDGDVSWAEIQYMLGLSSVSPPVPLVPAVAKGPSGCVPSKRGRREKIKLAVRLLATLVHEQTIQLLLRMQQQQKKHLLTQPPPSSSSDTPDAEALFQRISPVQPDPAIYTREIYQAILDHAAYRSRDPVHPSHAPGPPSSSSRHKESSSSSSSSCAGPWDDLLRSLPRLPLADATREARLRNLSPRTRLRHMEACLRYLYPTVDPDASSSSSSSSSSLSGGLPPPLVSSSSSSGPDRPPPVRLRPALLAALVTSCMDDLALGGTGRRERLLWLVEGIIWRHQGVEAARRVGEVVTHWRRANALSLRFARS